jgi:GNAT superfamily N-acetyltransferase
MPQSVEPFDPARHRRANFSSGVASIDNYLKLTAKKLSAAHAAAIFIIAEEGGEIIGYYALSAISIDASETSADKNSKLFTHYGSVPATLLSMLGVDQRWQGQGIGKLLLADALRRSLAASREVGSFCVVLDVLEDENMAKRLALYAGLGFRRCDTETGVRMFLTMVDLGASLESP